MIRMIAIFGAALAAASLSPAIAADETKSASVIVVNGRGDYDWRIACDVLDARGQTKSMQTQGRGRDAKGSVIARRVAQASCTATASERAPLLISLTSRAEDFVCPFELSETGACERALAAAETVEFQFAAR